MTTIKHLILSLEDDTYISYISDSDTEDNSSDGTHYEHNGNT